MALLDPFFSGLSGFSVQNEFAPQDQQEAFLTNLFRQLQATQAAAGQQPTPPAPPPGVGAPQLGEERRFADLPTQNLPDLFSTAPVMGWGGTVTREPSQPAAPPPQTGHILPDTPAPSRQQVASAPQRSTLSAEPTWRQTLRDVGMALQGKDTPDREEQARQRNHTIDLLVRQGRLDPESAQAIASADPNLRNQVFASLFTTKPPTMHDFEVLDPNTGEKIKVPHQYVNGQWVRAGAMPGGASPSIGTGAAPAPIGAPSGAPGGAPSASAQYAIPPPPPGTNPKDWRTAYTKETAENQAKARFNLPSSLDTVDTAVGRVGELLSRPDEISSVTGWQGWLPTVLPGSRATEARIDQVRGTAFLKAYETLRGAGAITQDEGKKAQAAAARLDDMKQGDPDFIDALKDFKREMENLRGVILRKAGVPEDSPEAANRWTPSDYATKGRALAAPTNAAPGKGGSFSAPANASGWGIKRL